MPELTASIKIGLGMIAATAALITGLLGNVLAANISAFFSGTPPKTGKRPVILWLAFFVSATLSVVAGSLATFAPVAPAKAASEQPRIVVTNVDGQLLQSDPKAFFMVCRDTVQLANTSDITTSVVAVGTQMNIDGTILNFGPVPDQGARTNPQFRTVLRIWKTGPVTKNYANVKTLDQFLSIPGVPLPVKVAARSIASVTIDFAMKFASALPQSVTATHVLRFPDVADIQTEPMTCK